MGPLCSQNKTGVTPRHTPRVTAPSRGWRGSIWSAGSQEGARTHRHHRAPRPAGAVAVVVVEPQGVVEPHRRRLHLHQHRLGSQGDLQPGHCAREAQGTPRRAPQHLPAAATGMARPGGGVGDPPSAPAPGTETPAPTLALRDGDLGIGPRAVCGDRGVSRQREGTGVPQGGRGLTWHPLLLAQPAAATSVGVRRHVQLGAQRRLEAPEPHRALGRKTTVLWGCHGTRAHIPTSPRTAVPGATQPRAVPYVPGGGGRAARR